MLSCQPISGITGAMDDGFVFVSKTTVVVSQAFDAGAGADVILF